jgi:hypothetical protein
VESTAGEGADARFDLALSAAEWAVRIPPQAIGSPSGQVFLPCVPVGQAREAIAIWLAILATHPPAGELQAGLPSPGSYAAVEVRNTFVPTWAYPGFGASYVTPSGVPQDTAAGYLLASAMTRLPQQRVGHVLAGAWASWLNWRTTDAQLAAALGIPMPGTQALVPGPSIRTAGPGPNPGPQSPLCST